MSSLITRIRHGLIIGLLLITPSCAIAQPTASLDRTVIGPGETVTLSIHTSDISASQPDLTPLQAHFRILGLNQSSQMSIINNQQSVSKTFQIQLLPLESGRMTIPALTINRQSTSPITITVRKTPSTQSQQSGGHQRIRVIAHINHAQTYVGAQSIYTVTIESSVPLSQAQLMLPKIPNATLKPLGKDQSFQRMENNQVVSVFKRRYTFSSRQAQTLMIKPTTLVAYVPDNRPNPNTPNNLFDLNLTPFSAFGPPPRRITAQSAPLKLRVLPAAQKDNWLPAYQLTLSQHWGQSAQNWRVGSPITRTIKIKALGISPHQLPLIQMQNNSNLNIYPDQQQYEQTPQAQRTWSVTHRQFAIVPTQPGTLELPSIKLNWWNMKTKKMQTALLPAKKITILPNPNRTTEKATPNTQKTNHPIRKSVQANLTHSQLNNTVLSPWFWVALVMGLLWLSTITGYWLVNKKSKTKYALKNKIQPKSSSLLTRLKTACQTGTPEEIQCHLIRWAQRHFNNDNIKGLEAIQQYARSEELIEQCRSLEQHLWSLHEEPYTQAEALWAAIQTELNRSYDKKGSKTERSTLPPLHPGFHQKQ